MKNKWIKKENEEKIVVYPNHTSSASPAFHKKQVDLKFELA